MSKRTDKRDKLLQQRREARLRGKKIDNEDRCKDCVWCDSYEDYSPSCSKSQDIYLNYDSPKGHKVRGCNADKPCPEYEPL